MHPSFLALPLPSYLRQELHGHLAQQRAPRGGPTAAVAGASRAAAVVVGRRLLLVAAAAPATTGGGARGGGGGGGGLLLGEEAARLHGEEVLQLVPLPLLIWVYMLVKLKDPRAPVSLPSTHKHDAPAAGPARHHSPCGPPAPWSRASVPRPARAPGPPPRRRARRGRCAAPGTAAPPWPRACVCVVCVLCRDYISDNFSKQLLLCIHTQGRPHRMRAARCWRTTRQFCTRRACWQVLARRIQSCRGAK